MKSASWPLGTPTAQAFPVGEERLSEAIVEDYYRKLQE